MDKAELRAENRDVKAEIRDVKAEIRSVRLEHRDDIRDVRGDIKFYSGQLFQVLLDTSVRTFSLLQWVIFPHIHASSVSVTGQICDQGEEAVNLWSGRHCNGLGKGVLLSLSHQR